jgi:hypothetical protein
MFDGFENPPHQIERRRRTAADNAVHGDDIGDGAAIEDDVKRPRRIITVRGVGYVLARSQDGEQGLK